MDCAGRGARHACPDPAKVKELLALKQNWPEKAQTFRLATQTLLADLVPVHAPSAPKPAAAPCRNLLRPRSGTRSAPADGKK